MEFFRSMRSGGLVVAVSFWVSSLVAALPSCYACLFSSLLCSVSDHCERVWKTCGPSLSQSLPVREELRDWR